jgi:hypothetical protein
MRPLGIRIPAGNTMLGVKKAAAQRALVSGKKKLSPSFCSWGPQLNLQVHFSWVLVHLFYKLIITLLWIRGRQTEFSSPYFWPKLSRLRTGM